MRDPRIDPMPGDVLRRNSTRTVVGTKTVIKSCVPWLRVMYLSEGRNCVTSDRISAWRKWAATAKVVKTAGVAQ